MPSDSDTIEWNDKGLTNLLKALSGEAPVGRVGILGTKAGRNTQNAETNASIGAKHEFGQEGMPIRSFLRAPITDNLQKGLEDAGAFDEAALKQVAAEKTLLPFVKKICLVAEGIVADAFATGGFGKWKPSDMRFKKNHQTLVETQQLRNSITSEVKAK